MRFSKCDATILTLLALVPAQLQPQIMPPQPGKLNIYSQPAGAAVSINGQQMQQRTNASFSVSPGTYQVSVTGPSLKCSKQVQVDPGQTVVLNCTTSGW